MRKVIGLIVLFLVSAGSVFGVIERTLIDFGSYEQKIGEYLSKEKQNLQNLVDKYKQEGVDLYREWFYSQENAQKLLDVWFDPASWKIENWKVELVSSARFIPNIVNSYLLKVDSKRWGNVMGIRIRFSENPFLSNAKIIPPFRFTPYYLDGSPVDPEGDFSKQQFTDEEKVKNGILMNVLQVKRVSVWVSGRNYKHLMSVVFRNEDGVEEEYFMGPLFFQGWRRLAWENPNYIEQVNQRVLQRLPLYPRPLPFKEFAYFKIYKPQEESGGDFVVYFKDVSVSFDRAVVQEELDIDDEKYWQILSKQKIEYTKRMLRRIIDQVELIELEKKRKAASTDQPQQQQQRTQ
ncbi:MAG: flagellar filament outer layer protein FlaA [Spirochaetia bacterium]|nr:flagellar filament outer layer protein FlaA [Spirochaetota bacterium]MDW8112112.1 flagellar filament outer layer protein FlaA [Spirochaetia bacterium]